MIMPRYFSPPRLRINARRLGWFFCLLAIVPVAMMIAGIWRLYDLHPQLQRELKEIYEVHRVIPSHRGTITDRNGMPLAMSANLYHAAADPVLLNAANGAHFAINGAQAFCHQMFNALPVTFVVDITQKRRGNLRELSYCANKPLIFIARSLAATSGGTFFFSDTKDDAPLSLP